MWEASIQHPVAHCMLALVGRRKRLVGERVFLVPCVRETSSGLKPALWLGRMLDALADLGTYSGYMMSRDDGRKARLRDYETDFIKYLTEVQDGRPDLIPESVDVGDAYGLARSGRRGSTTRARVVGVSKPDIDANQMWRKTELNVGRTFRPSSMMQYYTEIAQSLVLLLRYSFGL